MNYYVHTPICFVCLKEMSIDRNVVNFIEAVANLIKQYAFEQIIGCSSSFKFYHKHIQ